MKALWAWRWLVFLLALLLLAACAPAMATQAPAEAEVEDTPISAPTPASAPSQATAAPATPTLVPPTPEPLQPSPTPFIEQRTVELEWPGRLRLGESDIVRLSLIPSAEGYTAQAEFEEHTLDTRDVPVRHAEGYTLLGIARLDGVGFEISPSGSQPRMLPVGEAVTWRWSLAAHRPGQQRLSISLTLRWEPHAGVTGPVSETLAYDRGLNVQVDAPLGMTRSQALFAGMFCLLCGGGLGVLALFSRRAAPASRFRRGQPNRQLEIEVQPGLQLSPGENRLLQALFEPYARLVVEAEFRSGYSGARALLVHPARADGSADAATIAKIGAPGIIHTEYANYEQFVKDRLPPVTARIQHAPLLLKRWQLAGLTYTFIAEPGRRPLSLRQALQQRPDPAYLRRLFDTFGPHWWMQRQPYTFLAALEYDRLLPPHWVVEPAPGRGPAPRLTSGQPASSGSVVRLPELMRCELRPDGASWALESLSRPGQPGLRLRWLAAERPVSGQRSRLRASRTDLLRQWTAGFERFDLPDPLTQLENWLGTTLHGTRSTIHGDLNLENILVGPGELVWLIDFAATRQGHPLFDFAHLSAELIAHILTPAAGTPAAFFERLLQGDALLIAVEELASRCLFDPTHPEEYHLALGLACLGALKFPNLGELQKRCLYLAAAYQMRRLQKSS